MLLNIRQLMDDAKCYEVLRELRWPDGVKCPACDSGQINKRRVHEHQAHRQRYSCQECGRQFDDLSGTVFELHRQGLKTCFPHIHPRKQNAFQWAILCRGFETFSQWQFEFFWNLRTGTSRTQFAQVEQARNVPQAVIVSGLRRAGKSNLPARMAHRLGADEFYYVNFEDDRLLGFDAEDANDLYQILVEVFGERKTFNIDEIQYMILVQHRKLRSRWSNRVKVRRQPNTPSH